MNTKSSRMVVLNAEESVIAALDRFVPGASLPVRGKLLTSKDLQAKIQAHVDTMNLVAETRAKHSQLVALDNSQRSEMVAVLAEIRNYAAGLFGENSAEFAAFGFAPKKVAERTVESKMAAAEKARATRVARHTLGKRQKAAIHGVVPSPPANGSGATAPDTAPIVVTSPGAGTNGATPANATLNGTVH